MAKEIIINAEKEQTRIAIVENGEMVELYFENPDNARTLGDIYLGRIRRIMPSIKAAFVDIGQKQDAFLHFSDLAENLDDLLTFANQENPEVRRVARQAEHHRRAERRRPRHGKGEESEGGKDGATGQKHHVANAQKRGQRRSAQRRSKHKPNEPSQPHVEEYSEERSPKRGSAESLKRNQRILVKVVKEPISNKGSRVSTNISLAGRFLVLVPLADYAAVSKKVTSPKERRRLRALAKMLLPEGFGVIVRTVAEGKDAKSLDTDLRLLLEKWRKIEKKLAGRPESPIKVHEDVNMASSIIRDLFSDDYDRILVDQPRMHRNIKNYIQAVAPQMASAVQLHKGRKHIFETTKILRDIEGVFESRVDLPSGGYLFIERTEAMHVIDVNSGRSGRGMNQEENSLKVNLEAARVVARQVRLRDLGGILVVDFIDMREERNKKKVYDELKRQFRSDRAVTKILPMSDFGLMQITRQRMRPSITTTFAGPNADTNGAERVHESSGKEKKPRERDRTDRRKPASSQKSSGKPTRSPAELVKEMEQWIAAYRVHGKGRAVQLRVHPFTAAFLKEKIPTHPTRWFIKHRMRVRVEPDRKVNPLSFRFVDPRSGKDVTDLNGLNVKQGKKQQAGKKG
ncbi:MAG: Rne/Rng family ribonuclease [Rhodothermales bacterium]